MVTDPRAYGGSLTRDFALKFFVVSLFLALGQLALEYQNVKHLLLDQVAQRASAVADSFRMHAEMDPAFSIPAAANLASWKARSLPGLLGIYLVDPQGRIAAGAERNGGADEKHILEDATIRAGLSRSFDDQSGRGVDLTDNARPVWAYIAPLPQLGVATLVIADLKSVQSEMGAELIAAMARRIAVLAVLLVTLYVLMRGWVLRPISDLAAAVERSRVTGRFEPPARMPSNEIGALANLFGEVFRNLGRSVKENEMLAQVANGTHAGVLIADGAGRIVWVNAGFEHMTGFRRKEIEGRTSSENYSSRGKPIGAISALSQGVRFSLGYNVETINHAKDGRRYWASIEVRPIHDETGAIRTFIVIETDITDAKDTEAALKRSRRQLRERIDELQTARAQLGEERAKHTRMTEERAETEETAKRADCATVLCDMNPAASRSERETGANGGTLDILLAEDQPVNQKLMLAVMERLGHRLTIANNGVEALRALGERSFDLVLMDIQMPELDGISATKLIRESDESWRNIPIIAVTAHAADSQRETYIGAGMDGFVAKPFKIDALVAEMARVAVSGAKATGAGPQAEQAIADAERSLQREQKAILSAMLDELDSLTN